MATTIDVSRIPAPAAIEPLDFETMQGDFVTRFLAAWASARADDPSLPDYDVQMLETDPVMVVSQAFSYLRLLDRSRVNDAVRAVLAPLASGTDLDNIVARQGLVRLVTVPATDTTPAVYETDGQLRRRYLASFGLPAAGSREGYIGKALAAWPAVLDVRVNGAAVHGRRGNVDVVIIGPNGDEPTDDQRRAVREAVLDPSFAPEAVGVAVINATRVLYEVDLTIEVSQGPDADLVASEALARVWTAANDRMRIGGEIPPGLLAGSAYGPNVISVTDNSPVVIEPDLYSVPIMTAASVAPVVQS